MKKDWSKVEKYRLRHPVAGYESKPGDRFGAFRMRTSSGLYMNIIASDGSDEVPWEHVSVHVQNGNFSRLPTWVEMCRVKRLFWDDDETVLQFHPKQEKYVNTHEQVLHLWKMRGVDHKLPPTEAV